MTDRVRLIPGDCIRAMRLMAALGIQVDSIVTDPPYHLTSIVKRFGKADPAKEHFARTNPTSAYKSASTGFMGKHWDGGDIAFQAETWALALAVLKPGGHLLAFGGTRGWHRMAVAIEDAGFEIRDTVAWIYGAGFPKAHNLKNNHEIFCACGGNPVPCDHDEKKSEHDMRPLRGSDIPEAVNDEDQCGQVLFEGVPKQGAQERRAARTKPETGGAEQPGMGGRSVHRAGQGIRDDLEPDASEIEKERLRAGAYPGGGEDAGPPADEDRGSPPQGFEPGEQQAGEPENLCDPSGTLDGGALRHRGRCPRCGKLTEAFKGFSTALKPAFEPIVLARKPLDGTVAANVLAHGTGAINVDGCRVAGNVPKTVQGQATSAGTIYGADQRNQREFDPHDAGRWPANVVHDGGEEVEAAFAAFGESNSAANIRHNGADQGNVPFTSAPDGVRLSYGHSDSGTASRFFYSAKADALDRWGAKHPTVKPVNLMRWLVRLVTPHGGLVLDPFAGTGSTGVAALAEGMRAILIEADPEYQADIRARLAYLAGDGKHALVERARHAGPEKTGHADLPLFAGDSE